MNVESLRDTNNTLCVSYIIDLPEAYFIFFFFITGTLSSCTKQVFSG